MLRYLVLGFLAIAASGMAQETAPAKAADPFAPLRFMVGKWKGENTGQPGNGNSDRTYTFEFGERYLVARNTAIYPPQLANKQGETHHDMGIISYDRTRKLLVFRQFHSEGFVNQYAQDLATGSADTVVFVTEAIENIPPGWRARETYRRTGPDTMVETFELAEPGKPFDVYSVCRLRRVK